MSKIVKSFTPEKTVHQIETSGNTQFISWQSLKEYIKIAAMLRPNEQMDGIVVDEDGIKVRISKKL